MNARNSIFWSHIKKRPIFPVADSGKGKQDGFTAFCQNRLNGTTSTVSCTALRGRFGQVKNISAGVLPAMWAKALSVKARLLNMKKKKRKNKKEKEKQKNRDRLYKFLGIALLLGVIAYALSLQKEREKYLNNGFVDTVYCVVTSFRGPRPNQSLHDIQIEYSYRGERVKEIRGINVSLYRELNLGDTLEMCISQIKPKFRDINTKKGIIHHKKQIPQGQKTE